jgi:hypothetical protein
MARRRRSMPSESYSPAATTAALARGRNRDRRHDRVVTSLSLAGPVPASTRGQTPLLRRGRLAGLPQIAQALMLLQGGDVRPE